MAAHNDPAPVGEDELVGDGGQNEGDENQNDGDGD